MESGGAGVPLRRPAVADAAIDEWGENRTTAATGTKVCFAEEATVA